jgi:hypothetical protein
MSGWSLLTLPPCARRVYCARRCGPARRGYGPLRKVGEILLHEARREVRTDRDRVLGILAELQRIL